MAQWGTPTLIHICTLIHTDIHTQIQVQIQTDTDTDPFTGVTHQIAYMAHTFITVVELKL